MLQISTELSQIKNLPPRFLKKLERLGLITVRDLLWHFPARYEDFSQTYSIGNLEPNQQATIQAVVQEVDIKRTWKKRLLLTEATLADSTGEIKAIWFNQPYVKNALHVGKLFNFAGKVSLRDGEIYLSNPAYEFTRAEETENRHTGRLVPIYPETHGLTSKGLRFLMKQALDETLPLDEFIPEEILTRFALPEINEALRTIHFPKEVEEALTARKRFAFEDLFLLQLHYVSERRTLATMRAPAIYGATDFAASHEAKLPFSLTGAQKKTLGEITRDMERETPMNRLLQGDVGSGKTAVAALAALAAAKSGQQTAFMAPTEVLARQHYETLKKLFGSFEQKITTGLLTASSAKLFFESDIETETTKTELKKKINSGEIKIVIGTHALLAKEVSFRNLGFVVVDEQHRFGVRQRAELLRRHELVPHFLSMSATPIPRTLTLALFGDLDLSVIDEMPKGRRPIITKAVAPENRIKAYAFIRGEVKKGRQVFIICPRIEEKEEDKKQKSKNKWRDSLSFPKWDDAKTVKEEFDRLSKKVFPDLRLAILHGKMKAKEKESVMRAFSVKGGSASGGKNEIDILVSTSVIEVGVDVPNATVMVIEGAEHFGLAQLYQFRGRVGRGEYQSYCLLFAESSGSGTKKRLEALINAKNGFELAEKDLEIRGPGEFLGQSQAGLPDTAMRALKNLSLLKDAREAAEITLNKKATLASSPTLKKRINEFKKDLHRE